MDQIGLIHALTTGGGNAGDVSLTIDNLTLKDGAQIDVGTRDGSTGNGGNLTITASDTVSVSGSDSTGTYFSSIFSNTAGEGNAGSIAINTSILELNEGGTIDASTSSVRNSEDISVSSVGNAGNLSIKANEFKSTGGYVRSSTFGDGDAGNILIETANLTLLAGGQISVSNRIGSTGHGGNMTITATGSVSISGADSDNFPSGLFTSTRGSKDAGSMTISASNMSVSDGGGIFAYTSYLGKGGDLHLQVDSLKLINGGSITAQSTSTGNAGNITIHVRDVFSSENSSITTEASQAAGGNITFNGGDILLTENSEVTASVASGEGGGGNVTIQANSLVALEDSDITARADQGFGGDIKINAQVVLFSDDIDLDASSNVEGREGTVEVDSPVIDISGGLVSLPDSFLDAEALLPARCESRNPDLASSFVVLRHGGLTSGPDRLLPCL
jgi:large exoprotein involved in heme utilization and adhesion